MTLNSHNSKVRKKNSHSVWKQTPLSIEMKNDFISHHLGVKWAASQEEYVIHLVWVWCLHEVTVMQTCQDPQAEAQRTLEAAVSVNLLPDFLVLTPS